jgi:hypothetical protein
MRLRTAKTASSSAFLWHLAVLFIGFSWIGFTAHARESNFESQDPYEILGVEDSASKAEIGAAWRALVQLYHPDSGASDNDHIRRINDAYQLLKDEARRLGYDTGEVDFNGHFRRPDFVTSDRERDERERAGWSRFYEETEAKVRETLNRIDPALNQDGLVVLYGILSFPMKTADGHDHAQMRLTSKGHRKAYGQLFDRLGLMEMSRMDKRLICDHEPLEAIERIYLGTFFDKTEVKEAQSILRAFQIFYLDKPFSRTDFLNLTETLEAHDFLRGRSEVGESLRKSLQPVLSYYIRQMKESGCGAGECRQDLARAKKLLSRTQTLLDSAISCVQALLKK